MIKLQNLLSLNEMKYSSDIKSKHKTKMDINTEIINKVKIPHHPFPENSSRETRNELQWLLNYNEGVIDSGMSKDGDDIIKVFEKYCKENKLKFDKKYYEKILSESAKFILQLKYYYNRPRPYQLGEYYGIPDFKIHNLDSAKTPSYPSGHSTQGHLIAKLLSKKYSQHYGQLKELADFVSESRIMARAHYPSDVKFGEKVAVYLFNGIK